MSKAILTQDVRDVYWAQTSEYNFQVDGNNYKVRVIEDSNSAENLWWDGENYKKEDFPDAVEKFLALVSEGEVSLKANEGEEFDLEGEKFDFEA